MLEIIKKGQPQFKANLHSHSTLSDGKLSPAELKKIYKEHGYSVLAVTDHDKNLRSFSFFLQDLLDW